MFFQSVSIFFFLLLLVGIYSKKSHYHHQPISWLALASYSYGISKMFWAFFSFLSYICTHCFDIFFEAFWIQLQSSYFVLFCLFFSFFLFACCNDRHTKKFYGLLNVRCHYSIHKFFYFFSSAQKRQKSLIFIPFLFFSHLFFFFFCVEILIARMHARSLSYFIILIQSIANFIEANKSTMSILILINRLQDGMLNAHKNCKYKYIRRAHQIGQYSLFFLWDDFPSATSNHDCLKKNVKKQKNKWNTYSREWSEITVCIWNDEKRRKKNNKPWKANVNSNRWISQYKALTLSVVVCVFFF